MKTYENIWKCMDVYGQSAGMYLCTDSNISTYVYGNVWKYMVSWLECTFARIQIYQKNIKTYKNIWKCIEKYGRSAGLYFRTDSNLIAFGQRPADKCGLINTFSDQQNSLPGHFLILHCFQRCLRPSKYLKGVVSCGCMTEEQVVNMIACA